jgi:hypothetical protein
VTWPTNTRRDLEPGRPRDLLHAAVILRAEGDAAKIVSVDGDFDELAAEGIEQLDPADIEVWRQEVERGRA